MALLACVTAGAASSESTNAPSGAVLQVFPAQPRVGREATIQLRPYRLLSGLRVPAIVGPARRWRVTVSNRGRSIASPAFARDPGDPYVWTARFRFSRAGRWVLKLR